MLDLNDKEWKSLNGGYRMRYDASILLKELERTKDKVRIKEIKVVTQLIYLNQEKEWDIEFASIATAAIAAVNGQIGLAKTILEMNDTDIATKFDFFMDNYNAFEDFINRKKR